MVRGMPDERVVAILEARMGSSRLPGKSLRPLCGQPLVARSIERIRRARTLDEVVLATTTSPGDDVLEQLGREVGVTVFRGSESDVLGRILGAARAARATIHVQCWGDCAFVDPEQIDRVVAALAGSSFDLVGNTVGGPPRALPFGLDVIALRVQALERADQLTWGNAYHREHGTTFLYENPGLFRVHQVEPAPELRHPEVRLVIDRPADYEFVSQIYDRLYPQKPDFGIRDVLALIRRTPELLAHPNGRALEGSS